MVSLGGSAATARGNSSFLFSFALVSSMGIEREGLPFLSRVRDGYRALAQSMENARLIPAQGSPQEVSTSIREILMGAFPETFPPVGV